MLSYVCWNALHAHETATISGLTGVVDTVAVGPVENGVAEVGAARGAKEDALCKHRAEDDHCHDGLGKIDGRGRGVDDASVDGAEDNASTEHARNLYQAVIQYGQLILADVQNPFTQGGRDWGTRVYTDRCSCLNTSVCTETMAHPSRYTT